MREPKVPASEPSESLVNLAASETLTELWPPTPAVRSGVRGSLGLQVVEASTDVNGAEAALGKSDVAESEKHARVMFVASPPPNHSNLGTSPLASFCTRKLRAFPTPPPVSERVCHALKHSVSELTTHVDG